MRDISELRFENIAPLVRPQDIARFQQRTGVHLPPDYIRFLQQVNGGNPELDMFRLKDGEEWAASSFYHLTMDAYDTEDLLWNFEALRQALPAGVIPIASNAGGDQVCLDLRPGTSCQVIVWDHEFGGLLRPAVETFEALIDSLYLDPDYL